MPLLLVEVGALFGRHLFPPSLLPLAEGLVHLVVAGVFFVWGVFEPDGLFTGLGCRTFFLVPRFRVGPSRLSPAHRVHLEGGAHFDADGFDFRVLQQRGDALVDLGFHGVSFGLRQAFPAVAMGVSGVRGAV